MPRIVVHHTKFYDWEPVPSDVKITDDDVKAGRVKQTRDGLWKMRVTKTVPDGASTHTTILMPEAQVIEKILHQRLRPDGGDVCTRSEAIAHYLQQNQLPHHTNRKWLTKIEVEDDGPDEKLARAMFAEHVKAKNLEDADFDEHMEKYLVKEDHVKHLHEHFKVKQ